MLVIFSAADMAADCAKDGLDVHTDSKVRSVLPSSRWSEIDVLSDMDKALEQRSSTQCICKPTYSELPSYNMSQILATHVASQTYDAFAKLLVNTVHHARSLEENGPNRGPRVVTDVAT
ncbi:7c932383-6ef3-4b44-aad6-cd3f002481e3 [Sclerotinia trifoliorum]|uniref:7c932383-6ef3-4b44-aad6-cd3f002481e3 n=1 Tax=Sclerotinia trifoliorum TaxID=28548 RepID=A0A8H2VY40_9HELO|nr:7c932383-6ef3-4b44-aad6-cd3f002481e3 [Sclerotinia trifoliorum]